ncbi:hypothetical protein SLEP1_g39425 [Rubroshorea leprosula]|uniref:Uncharacterized protein n=1 Tax=Rubroshorea leprosula TaxID=152421 RepID=A0AAV5L0J4_9ROSI|nr:hypothetical protein SLEP1_g39425 [Rubroshorea leprosula]
MIYLNLFCLRCGYVISDPTSGDYTLAHVDLLVIELVRSSDPVSGDYTLVNSALASGWFITLAVIYIGDIYFVPVVRPDTGGARESDELDD